MLLLCYFECALHCSAEYDKRIFTGEGNHFPQNRQKLSLAGEPENRQALTERGAQEKFSAVVTSVISVQ